MRKRIFGRRLKRDKDQRRALFRSLISAVILEERISTTEAKAKAIRSTLEKLITKAKKLGQDGNSLEYLNAAAHKKLVQDVAPRFANRAGGYTRIIHLGRRMTDSASLVYLELTEQRKAVAVLPKKETEGEPKVSKVSKGREVKVKKDTKKSTTKK